MRAGIDTVHTRHATAVVHRMVLAVNACRLAFARTKSAGITFVLVYRNAQQGKTGQETEYRTYRTDSIAKVRPFLHANTTITMKVMTATRNVGRLFSHTVVS